MNVPDYQTASYDETSEPVAQITNLADNFLKRGYQQFQFASKTFDLDKYSEEIGLGPISKQLTLDRLKTILAGYAMIRIFTAVRSNMLKIAVLGGAGYLLMQKRDQISSLFNKAKYIEDHLAPTEPVYQPTMVTDQTLGYLRNKAMGDFGK
jgi:hypothetical protein